MRERSMVSDSVGVQPRYSRATLHAEVPQFRQRSTLSVPLVANQSADTGGDGNQVHPLCSPVPPVRGKADRHTSTRVFGSHVVLDHCSISRPTSTTIERIPHWKGE